ncbi:ornithine carbamoyltransferase [Synergistes jonesii]|uniref:Ornithine carbamoyltransferase n=1 Tax=Synergistes jonesii TaxID=2754 RepID=A0A073IMJ7_9BACT|nr:ornithine carbamoyltransferase [Synergistes jonesii]KEJ91538.1 ornithine carbamoyltransferase [Synergistes jonesii]MDY2985023.1 ornithine carbamoyltransferase [Synergistes jonesii]OFB60587.1 ornithine carbamoyltransferase [Synergistes jonesii]OFB61343.1 ornithine carbamoyltransferase [Synergistes jonesii]OFB64938.1 ornithine carbamoyltransferase [Synergistes jonesii]
MPVNLRNRNLISLKHHTPEEIDYLLSLAADLKNKKRAGIKGNLLDRKNVALIFEKPSTRTRCAFTVAAIDEGGHPEYLGKNDIQLGHKEDVADTARVLGRMFDGIEFRGFSQKVVEDLAKYAGVPVWNGLTDDYHPTQVLADFLTIRENFGRLKGIKLVYVGDGRNNVANSLMIGAAKMGMRFVVGTPKELYPDPALVEECEKIAKECESGATIEVFEDPKVAVKDADVIYTDVWASMGEEAKTEERKKLLKPYQVNMELVKATGNEDVIFLHCLPAVKGNEVTEEVFESRHARQFDEAENRMHTIKAVMVASIGNF